MKMHVNFNCNLLFYFDNKKAKRSTKKCLSEVFRLIKNVTVSKYFLSPPIFQSNPYGLKDSGPTSDMSWTTAGLQPTTGYYSPYDPTLAAYG